MKATNGVQILAAAVCISHNAYILRKYMNLNISLQLGVNSRAYWALCMATNQEEGKL